MIFQKTTTLPFHYKIQVSWMMFKSNEQLCSRSWTTYSKSYFQKTITILQKNNHPVPMEQWLKFIPICGYRRQMLLGGFQQGLFPWKDVKTLPWKILSQYFGKLSKQHPIDKASRAFSLKGQSSNRKIHNGIEIFLKEN